MLFSYQDVEVGVKSMARSLRDRNRVTHCQALDVTSKTLGYQSYHHFRSSLKQLPQERFTVVSLSLMRRICAAKLPSRDDCTYFEFIPLPKGIGYYSRWLGWDANGEEVRVPRPLIGKSSVMGLRKSGDSPVYVVESERELLAWQYVWRATAYIPEALAKVSFPTCFDKRHLISDTPAFKRESAQDRYSNNMASDSLP